MVALPATGGVALLFSCAHFALLTSSIALPRVLFEVVSAFPPALVAGYIYQRTGNIWYGVFLHALGNFGGAQAFRANEG